MLEKKGGVIRSGKWKGDEGKEDVLSFALPLMMQSAVTCMVDPQL